MQDIIINETIEPLGPMKRLKIKLADFRNQLAEKLATCPGVASAYTWWQGLNKKQQIGLGISLIVLIVSGVIIAARGSGGFPSLIGKKGIDVEVNEPSEPKDREALLDGVLITQSQYDELSKRKPLAVMVDNHVNARPAAGLNKADLVYEALVEGGITRFIGVFWRQTPESVGPVRSIRSYHLDWIAELNDAFFMHIGGAVSSNPAANALAKIQQYGMKSLGISGRNTFWRINEKQAPHNAYTSTKNLWEEAEKIGWGTEGTLTTWKFKADKPAESADKPADTSVEQVEEKTIKINWSSWGETPFSVVWAYDAEKNIYLREQAKAKAIDEITKEQLFAKNVVLQYCLQTLTNDGTARILYETIGKDKAQIFLDGKVIEGTWEKKDIVDRTRFFDSNNNEVEFNRGTTWIEVVPVGSEIEYN